MLYSTSNEEQTIALGEQLAREYPIPVTMLLIGELGAGKTTLAKGIASGYGAAQYDDVSSPTFPQIHEYGAPTRVYHVDLYRLETVAEVETLGLDEIFERPAAVLLEWAERFPKLLPKRRIEIRLAAVEDEAGCETRRIEVTEVNE